MGVLPYVRNDSQALKNMSPLSWIPLVLRPAGEDKTIPEPPNVVERSCLSDQSRI
jgi:hypothetical protein